MSKFAIWLLILAICATALVAVLMVTPAKAETSSSKKRRTACAIVAASSDESSILALHVPRGGFFCLIGNVLPADRLRGVQGNKRGQDNVA